MSSFVKHTPCPKCGSRDNLGNWSDGHQWCFGCGYYQPAKRTLETMRAQLNKSPHANSPNFPRYTNVIPSEPLKWLKSYGITDDEIRNYGLCFDLERETLMFPLRSSGNLSYVGRYFGSGKGTRYISVGEKPRLPIQFGSKRSILIFVEDIISAIKIGRQYTASPVLGSHISLEALKWASGEFKEVGVWLDSDMVYKSARIVQKGRLLTDTKIFRVHTKLDPKYYSNEEIENIVEKARNFF